MKYEYTILTFASDNLGDLNQLGQNGWQVVSVSQKLNGKFIALLSRAIQG